MNDFLVELERRKESDDNFFNVGTLPSACFYVESQSSILNSLHRKIEF